ncbi:hypothetical protein TRAPUB_9735 [Trametes pubescens]|uniref:Uncharacterized protein n=1 Tax=Trametes pubescens TaxID=154538 RepID=A0A1M2W1J5_TRAPU|nr:hypothetical protein TRAPUB_9735 [Trametes pubescens]
MDTQHVAIVPPAAGNNSEHTLHHARVDLDVNEQYVALLVACTRAAVHVRVQRAKQRIAAEVLSHEAESLRLRGLLNAHAPINCLPPEILSLIFVHYAIIFQREQFARFSLSAYHEPEKSAHKQIYTWLRVARVCRHWREVALQCASLWNFLVIDERVPEDVLRTFLARSQGMPLTIITHAIHQDQHCGMCVCAEDATANLDAGATVLEETVERATKLNLYLWNVNYDRFWDILMGSASKLTSLHIEAAGHDRYDDYMRQHNPAVVVPKLLFKQHPPPLRSLSLTGVGLAWSNALFYASIRRLELVSCVMTNDSGIVADLGDLLGALRGMPNLEAFAIDSVSLPDSEISQYDLVDLPSLQRLRVPIEQQNTLNMVLHLRFPHDAYIYFTGKPGKKYSADLLSRYTEGMPHLMGSLQAYAISICDDVQAEYCQLWVKAPQTSAPSAPSSSSADPDEDEDPTWEEIAATQPRFRFDCSVESGLIHALLAGLDTQHLRVLSVAHQYPNQREWLDAFARATHVRTLRMQGQGALGLGAVLARWRRPAHMNQGVDEDGHAIRPHDHVGFGELLDDGGADARAQDGYAPGPLPFPCLRTLRFAAVDFPLAEPQRELALFWPPHAIWGYEDGSYGLDVAGLVKGLRVRTERGAARVTRIEFEGCQCWERQRLAPLVGAVSEVWWEGKRLAWNDLGEQGSVPVNKEVPWRVLRERGTSPWGGEADDY